MVVDHVFLDLEDAVAPGAKSLCAHADCKGAQHAWILDTRFAVSGLTTWTRTTLTKT